MQKVTWQDTYCNLDVINYYTYYKTDVTFYYTWGHSLGRQVYKHTAINVHAVGNVHLLVNIKRRIKLKTIFIKDDRLREIVAYRNEKIVELMLKGKLESSYTIRESTKEYKTKTYPFYEIYFGWDIEVSDDNWKIKDNR